MSARVTDGPAYGAFAAVYAAHWEDYARLMLEWFPELTEHFGLDADSVVDLACGTGYFATGLARSGVGVVGIDGSEAMLAIARRRARRAGVSVKWSVQDMRDAEWSTPADVVTCWFDSLNYLMHEDGLGRTFERVFAMLRSGGAFLFDVNTIDGLRKHSAPSCAILVDTPSCFVVSDSEYDVPADTSRLIVHGFVRGRRGFRRFREEHLQRGYRLEAVSELLERAGFSSVELFRRTGYIPADEGSSRAYGIARKP